MKQFKKDQLDKTRQQMRVQMAKEQAAMHSVNLAVARWSAGCCTTDSPPSSAQARWHEHAQNSFIEWLSNGGFSQAPLEHVQPADAEDRGQPVTLRTGSKRQAKTLAKNHPCTA